METPEQMDQTSPEPMQDSQFINISIEGDKIRCEIRGDHDKLAGMVASVMVNKNAPLRQIVDDAILAILSYETSQRLESGDPDMAEILNLSSVKGQA
jgi:hypothetical protein